MSSTNTTGAGNTFATQPPPTHHTHKSSDVLPGARGASQVAQDYSTNVTENPRVWQDEHERKYGAGSDTRAVVAGGQHDAPNTGSSAFEGERPMGVQPTEQGAFSLPGLKTEEDADYFLAGGVAIGGEANLPEGHAKMTDKIIGKTQKVCPLRVFRASSADVALAIAHWQDDAQRRDAREGRAARGRWQAGRAGPGACAARLGRSEMRRHLHCICTMTHL